MSEEQASYETGRTAAPRPGENPMQPKVDGYRKLSDEELALVNEIKSAGVAMEDLIGRVNLLVDRRGADTGSPDGKSKRCAAIAQTELQTGAMWLIRAVAAPNGLF